MFVRVCSSFCTVVAVGETDTRHLFPPIMYTLNLCSASLRKQWDGMPVLAMTHELTLERKSASYDLATTEWREPEGGEKQRGNDFEERKRSINEGVEMALCSRLCIFHLWSRHLCSFSHLCLMLSQTSPGEQLQCVCLALFLFHTLPHIISSLFVSPTEAKQTDFPS